MIRGIVLLYSWRTFSRERWEWVFRSDPYHLLLSQLVDRGFIQEAHIVSLGHEPHAETRLGVGLHSVRSLRALPPECASCDGLWVRADRRSYIPVIRDRRYRLRMFYAAEETQLPCRTAGYDVVMVDENWHIPLVEKALPGACVERFLKTVDPALFHPLPDQAEDYDVCCVGVMANEKKKIDCLIPIMQRLPHLRYVVAGRVEENLARRLKATGAAVTCLGDVERGTLNEVFNASRVCVLPSELDAAPRVIIEAMASGAPVVVNARMVGGPGYVTERAGIVTTLDRFPDAIERILADSQAFDPAEEFKQRYSPEKAADRLAEIVERGWAQRRPDRALWWPNLRPVAAARKLAIRRRAPELFNPGSVLHPSFAQGES